MSRSGYSDDIDDVWALIRWRGAVKSAIRGRRGQAFLAEMLQALDALPEPKLITGELVDNGAVCALGAVGLSRGLPMENIDPYDRETVAGKFGIAEALAAEIMWVNDDESSWHDITPEQRFRYVRQWVLSQLDAVRFPTAQE